MRLSIIIALAASIQFFSATAQYKKPLPAYKTTEEKNLQQSRNGAFYKQQNKNSFSLRSDMRYPGEFEESQIVLISWADLYDENTNEYIGADTATEWGYVSAQLADAIQQEVPVWIRVFRDEDSLAIKKFMSDLGTPLTNYRFITHFGDAWWMRDFGPIGVYYSNQDSLAFVDLKYYDGRDSDDVYPAIIASIMEKPLYTSTLRAEGGNLMTDGFGTTFFSTVIGNDNSAVGAQNPRWTRAQTLDTLSALLNIRTRVELPKLSCDGGTGHIDLYTKMIDEQTIMVVQMPDSIIASDRQRIEDNYQMMTLLQSPYGRPYRIFRIPHPTDDNGFYSRRNCASMNDDARTFVNGLTVNNTFIFPSYSNEFDGNEAQTEQVTNIFKSIMSGYNIVPIDSRALSPFGGELHCITMQIPAENPVHFWHPSVDRMQPIQASYPIISKITNKSGVANAKCFWRIRGNTTWNTVNLTDSAGYFIGAINSGILTQNDAIEYYLEAETNNGKIARKPITAPRGYYTIFYQWPTSLEPFVVVPKNHLFQAYPNPASQAVSIDFQALQTAQAVVRMIDITGKVVTTQSLLATKGLNTCHFDLQGVKPGVYLYQLVLDEQIISTRKFVVK
jgi:agmatine/peptidylarginine deiminase